MIEDGQNEADYSGNTAVKQLCVSREHLEMLRTATQGTHPKEACGVLFGHQRGNSLTAVETKILPNVDRCSVSFTIDPIALYKALMDAEGRGLSPVAIFHSHAIEAHPSSRDKKFMKWWPIPWLILSTKDDEFGAFILDNDEYREVKLLAT